MPSPTSAVMTGPFSGDCGVESTDFTITLDQPAGLGGVVVTVSDSEAGDTITSSPFTIAAGNTTGTFTITPGTGGSRFITYSTVPALTTTGSRFYNAICTATLTGPTSALCSLESTPFTVTLAHREGVGDVVVTVVSTVGGDTITASPFTIAGGDLTGTFTITPTTCGHRSISITTEPAFTIVGSPIDYNALCNCPDDDGTVSRVQTWPATTLVCPPTFFRVAGTTPTTVWAKDLYCTSDPLTITFTE